MYILYIVTYEIYVEVQNWLYLKKKISHQFKLLAEILCIIYHLLMQDFYDLDEEEDRKDQDLMIRI